MNELAGNSRPRTDVLLVSATDRRFFPMLQSMLATLRPRSREPAPDIACFDIGMDETQRAWLRGYPAQVMTPRAHFGIAAEDHDPHLLSFLARPFLPDYFPGYAVYVWIDSDVWFQDARALDRYIAGARDTGFAIAHESEPAYRFQPRLFGWTAKHFLLGYGAPTGAWLISRRHLNAGFFAGHADAPHWAEWARRYRAAIARTGKLVPHDQFALVQALHARPANAAARLPATFLPPTCNWIVDRGVPMWNDAAGAFCQPRAPYDPIEVLHLAGPGKRLIYDVRRTGGGGFATRILPGASPGRGIAASPEEPAITVASPAGAAARP